MTYPETYQHVWSSYQDIGSYIGVTMRPRRQNMFNEPVENTVTAKLDTLHGTVIEWAIQDE